MGSCKTHIHSYYSMHLVLVLQHGQGTCLVCESILSMDWLEVCGVKVCGSNCHLISVIPCHKAVDKGIAPPKISGKQKLQCNDLGHCKCMSVHFFLLIGLNAKDPPPPPPPRDSTPQKLFLSTALAWCVSASLPWLSGLCLCT